MRGKVQHGIKVVGLDGITPAYAGKSQAESCGCMIAADHPRVCGEKSNVPPWERLVLGSPPRMRGKGGIQDSSPPSVGITPAYAGKSGQVLYILPVYRDHPRVCGEKCIWGWYVSALVGSPPRMRGKGSDRNCTLVVDGITPAYAGKRRFRASSFSFAGDHPRVCGEKA